MEFENLKKIFKPNCIKEPPKNTYPIYEIDRRNKEYKSDKGKNIGTSIKEYIATMGESLRSISDDIITNKDNKYIDIIDDFKKLQYKNEKFQYPWQYLAKYNYGTIDPPEINFQMCKRHGFQIVKEGGPKYPNLTSDGQNYRYKGGEIVYYPVKVYDKTGKETVYIRPDDTPGLILHPSLTCPSLVDNDSILSILVLGMREKPIDEIKVNLHLKILPWSVKIGEIKNNMLQGKIIEDFSKALFQTIEEAKKNIKCNKISISKIIEDKNGRYSLIPDQRVTKTYNDYGYTDLYNIEIKLNSIVSEQTCYNLFWINLNCEKEDEIIQRKMTLFFGNRISKLGENYYGFAVETRPLFFDKQKSKETRPLFFEKLQPNYPICSYHPVVYKMKKHFNIAHLADLHLTARFTLMKHNEAKILESDDIPTVGSMLNDPFDSCFDLFNQAGSDPDIDMVLISGDIVDYLKSFYPVEFIDKKNKLIEKGEYGPASELVLEKFYNTVGSIWKAVGVDNEDEANNKYQDCVDFITIYSIILHFYQNYGKPVFLVSGNHDAYILPYGVSPRVLIFKGWRANAGIPADMNLTIYEAIMCYGDKYGKALGGLKMFDKDKLEIFYSLFTPMKDFCLHLPNFTLIGLSWGEDEDKIDILDKIPIIGHIIGRDDQESDLNPQSVLAPRIGHLPRADDAISDEQIKIIDFALNKNKKNILFSHFTFISYDNDKSIKSSEEGDVKFDWHWEAGRYDMGTFEKNRKLIYEKYLGKEKKLHYILTGHSHRRGLYEITDIDYWGDNYVETRFFGFSHHNNINGPKIIVSDSAGPIPRYNYDGEFSGCGSSIPSFTKMVFNDMNGDLKTLKAVVTNNICAKPRFAVALDYIYLLENVNLIKKFKTEDLAEKDYWKNTEFVFLLSSCYIPIKKKKVGLNITEFSIYFYFNKIFHKATVSCLNNTSDHTIRCHISFTDDVTATAFKRFACNCHNRTVFASIKFQKLRGSEFEQYDYNKPYIFEVLIEKNNTGLFWQNKIFLKINRNTDNNEYPDLDWRKVHFKDKYCE